MPGQHSQPTPVSLDQACLGVNCNLHFWHNDRVLLRANVVVRGGTDTEQESAKKVGSGEKNSTAVPARTQARTLSITSPALYQQAIL